MKKILVIDDESIIRRSCERILAPDGFDVKSVPSGRDGIALLEQEAFDLILLDLKMPDMDGIDVLKEIMRVRPGAKVIIVSGYSTPETAAEAIELGASAYINKPFTPGILIDAVNKAIRED